MKFEKIWSFFSNSTQLEIPYVFYFWLIVAFIFLIMEIGNPGLFFFLSFFFGGLSAAIVSHISSSITFQVIAFFVGTILALYVLRQWGIYLIGKNRSVQQTNFYALKGKRARVNQEIAGDKPGLVNINGQIWAARTIHEDTIHIGDIVEVIDVRGAHVVVKKI